MSLAPYETAKGLLDPNFDPQRGALPMVDPSPQVRASRSGRFVTIRATSILAPPVYYHFWLDGSYLGRTTDGLWTVTIPPGERGSVTVRATRAEDYDTDANPPDSFSGILSLEWVRSGDADADRYLLQTRIVGDAAGFVTQSTIKHTGAWRLTGKTPILDDDERWNVRVVPVDEHGNKGTRILYGARRVLRTPDQPNVTITFDSGDVTVAAAS